MISISDKTVGSQKIFSLKLHSSFGGQKAQVPTIEMNNWKTKNGIKSKNQKKLKQCFRQIYLIFVDSAVL